jgi:hypothetical protein
MAAEIKMVSLALDILAQLVNALLLVAQLRE